MQKWRTITVQLVDVNSADFNVIRLYELWNQSGTGSPLKNMVLKPVKRNLLIQTTRKLLFEAKFPKQWKHNDHNLNHGFDCLHRLDSRNYRFHAQNCCKCNLISRPEKTKTASTNPLNISSRKFFEVYICILSSLKVFEACFKTLRKHKMQSKLHEIFKVRYSKD